ncbi:hypothetical protein SOVF_000770 [Spinacia oleracea]|nr:hypothetical protein SOVF_000770 [Spinacia oleracea]
MAGTESTNSYMPPKAALMKKRGKLAGNALGNQFFASQGGIGSLFNLPNEAGRKYEFICSTTPSYHHYFRNRRRSVKVVGAGEQGRGIRCRGRERRRRSHRARHGVEQSRGVEDKVDFCRNWLSATISVMDLQGMRPERNQSGTGQERECGMGWSCGWIEISSNGTQQVHCIDCFALLGANASGFPLQDFMGDEFINYPFKNSWVM